MRIGEYGIFILSFIQLCGICGIWYFKEPPVEYFPYLVSLIALWGAFGFSLWDVNLNDMGMVESVLFL